MELSNTRIKTVNDRNRPTFTFATGDKVLLENNNLPQLHLRTSKAKMKHHFIGPYTMECINNRDTYKLLESKQSRLHHEFHVSYLNRYNTDEEHSNPRRERTIPLSFPLSLV